MKFTSEDLLKAMGLKDGDYITFEDDTRIFEVVQEKDDLYLMCDLRKLNFFIKTINKNFIIIQPKPTLTEDEKVILRNLPKQYKFIMRDGDKNKDLIISSHKMIRSSVKDNWCIIPKDKECECMVTKVFVHLFQFIKWEDEPYSIEELLKE